MIFYKKRLNCKKYQLTKWSIRQQRSKKKNQSLCKDLDDLEQLKYEVSEKNDFIRSIDLQLKERDSKIAEMDSCLTDDIKRYNSLKEQNESLISTINKKGQQNDELEILVDNLKINQNKLLEEIKKVIDERNVHQDRNLELKMQLEYLEQSETGLRDVINNYKDSFLTLESDNKQIKEKYDTFQANIVDIRNLSEEILTIKTEKLVLEKRLTDLIASIAELTKSNFEFKQNEVELSSRLADINEIKDKLEYEIRIIVGEKRTIQKELDENKKENCELEIELEKSRTLLNNMEQECHLLKQSMNAVADDLLQLQQERDSLQALKDHLENEFEQKLTRESDLIQADLTNIRSQNYVLTDQIESLQIDNTELNELLQKSIEFSEQLKTELKLLTEKLQTSDNVLKSLEIAKKELRDKLSVALTDCNKMTLEKEHLVMQISTYEEALTDLKNENTRLHKDKELIIVKHKEQFEKATSKVGRMKVELENSVQQYNRYRKENDEMKLKLSSKEGEICELNSRFETMLSNKEIKDSDVVIEVCENQDENGWIKHIEMELQSLKEEHSKCVNIAREKDELLKQLHEMQKMHVYKMKQYQQEIHSLKSQLSDEKQKICNQNYKDNKSINEGDCYNRLLEFASENGMELDEMERKKIIKSLIGENDDLRVKNQNLTVELQESRKISQKDRKSKRQSTHDEKRPLLWTEIRDIGTMTMPTDKLCNCERLDKELSEVKKQLLLRNCQINTILMESEHNPLKEECEALKRSIEEEEMEKKNIRKELCVLKATISELYKESKKCDQCLRRSMTIFVNQFSQTALANEQSNATNTNSKVESEYLKLQNKYEELKRLCRIRNTRIQELENKLSKEKENETNNRQFGTNTTFEGTIESLSRELNLVKKKYEEARFVCGYREKHIKSLETKLDQIKNGS